MKKLRPFKDKMLRPFKDKTLRPFKDNKLRPFKAKTLRQFDDNKLRPFKDNKLRPFNDKIFRRIDALLLYSLLQVFKQRERAESQTLSCCKQFYLCARGMAHAVWTSVSATWKLLPLARRYNLVHKLNYVNPFMKTYMYLF